jgi:hypothetical protein
MWLDSIRKRKEALRLVKRAGPEVAADFGKSAARQLLEICLLSLRGYSAADYYLLGLYKPGGRAKNFMTLRQYNDVRRKLNRPVVGIIEFNKWIFGKYCASVGISTPHCYGIFHRDIGFSERLGSLREAQQLWSLLVTIASPFVVKPLAGDRGESVRVFDRVDRDRRMLTGANGAQTAFEDLYRELISKEEPWLLQEKVQQHPILSELHGTSVNTARVITFRGDDGEVNVLAAALRIGIGSAEIDNTTEGGIAANIDLASGICGPATSRSSIRLLTRHPDTGRQIEGLRLPYWDNVKATALLAHQFLPFARSLGWDIAFGLDGPVILEVNGSWYYNRVQMTGQSLWDTAFGTSLAAQSIKRRSR